MKVDLDSAKDFLKKFTSQNSLIDNLYTLILVIYIIYGAFAVPFAFYLLSLSIGLIVFGALESFDAAVIATVISGVLAVIISQSSYGKPSVPTKEGFQAKDEGVITSEEAPSQDSAEIIARRVAKIDRNKPNEPGPLGVLASDYVEGFQNVSEMQTAEVTGQPSTNGATESSSNSTPTPAATAAETAAVAPQSHSAPVNTAATMPPSNLGTATQTNAVEAALATGSGTTQVNNSLGKDVAANVAQITKQGFMGGKEDGLFKLGEIPRDLKGGFHIDQGTTVLNALNALKPDQVKQMSEDTQKLIDTQKSLMSMLGTMKPMMADGKQLLETFQQMFGPGSAPSSVGQA